ncbi:MAG: prepilin-type cleavage/methylation domain-containing protein [Dictyoglomus sp. NZ13-RE01]|nr:MAG: prepilin-type cleavage/methylation domain-containing protein [Dictyoglomus sp. NZ13-RE01]
MRNGFTLLEVIIAVGILVVVFFIAYTSFRSSSDDLLLIRNFTNKLKEDLRYVRQRSILLHATSTLTFIPHVFLPNVYTSYTFMDDLGRTLSGTFTEGRIFTSDNTIEFNDGDLTDSVTITITLNTYTSWINVNKKGFIEVNVP